MIKKSKKSLKEKVQEEFPEFAAVADALSVAELESKLAEHAKYAEQNEDAKEADEELKNTQSLAKELGAPYRDAKKAIRMKSRYIIATIRDKGGNA